MKLIIGFVILSLLGLTTSAPNNYGRYPTEADAQELMDALENVQAMVDGNVESFNDEAADEQQIVSTLLPLLSDFLIPAVVKIGNTGYNVSSKFVKYLVNCGVCNKCSKNEERAQILSQYYTDLSGRGEVLMAMVEAVVNMNAMDEKLSEAQVDAMKEKLIAEAQYFSKIKKLKKKAIKMVKKGAKFLKKAAKKALCD